MARDGMSGALDFGVLIKVMEMYNLSNKTKLDILDKVTAIEQSRISNKKKNEKIGSKPNNMSNTKNKRK